MLAAAKKTRTRFENILFSTDFSASSENAVPYVKLLARHFESSVTVLHVRPPVVGATTQAATWAVNLEATKILDSEHRKELFELFAEFPQKVIIEQGSIEDCLNAALRQNDIDLIVIGTRGRSGLGKLLLGSVAEQILRNAPCPVLTVGPGIDIARKAKSEFREILFATDFSAEAKLGAAYAVSLAEEYQARLVLLHVVAECKVGELVSRHDVEASSRQLLRNLVPLEAEAWCKPEFVVESGDPAERIVELARQRGSDLIVLGARTEKGLPGAATHLPFAVAHKVVSKATCPVLTVRHGTRP
jgi:nucleotide-binding universal stress UspA family protein